MYQNILVPLDGSKLAECVLPHVEALTRGFKAKVTFLRVIEPRCPKAEDAGDYDFPEEVVRRIESKNRDEAQGYLKKVMAAGPYDDARIESVILSGDVVETMMEYIARNHVDLIVMATHGLSGLSRWVWGSVADRILRSAGVPVLIVRPPGLFPGSEK